jgi:hypothetical protein
MKCNRLIASSILAICTIAGASAGIAQTSADPHHPSGTPAITAQATQPKQMPPGPGMGSDQMPGRGMMGDMMGPGGMMDMIGRGCPMMAGGDAPAFAEGRIAFLKAELAITDAQKAAWEPYAAAVKKNLQGMPAMRQAMMKVMEAKTPVERLDARIAAMDGHLASLKDAKPALAALYAALSADQKTKADQILTGMGCMM